MNDNKGSNKNKKRRNKKQKKKNNNTNNDQSKNQKNNDGQKTLETFTKEIISSSPRPNTLVKNHSDMKIKRSSGSEFEDFQTPSIEMDIKGDYIIENEHGDFSDEYDNEWEELASFPSKTFEKFTKPQYVSQNETIKENGIIEKEGINLRSIKTTKDSFICNGDIPRVVPKKVCEFIENSRKKKLDFEEKDCIMNKDNNYSLKENFDNFSIKIDNEMYDQKEEEESLSMETSKHFFIFRGDISKEVPKNNSKIVENDGIEKLNFKEKDYIIKENFNNFNIKIDIKMNHQDEKEGSFSMETSKDSFICNRNISREVPKNDSEIVENDIIENLDSKEKVCIVNTDYKHLLKEKVDTEMNVEEEGKVSASMETSKDYFIYYGDIPREVPINDSKIAEKGEIKNLDSKEKDSIINTDNNNSLTENIVSFNSKVDTEWYDKDEVEDISNNENCARFVDQIFEDLDDECYKYPIVENTNKGILSINGGSTNIDIRKEVDKNESFFYNTSEIIEPYIQTVMKDENKEDRNMNESFVSLVCTEENLQDETLSVKKPFLDVFYEPSIKKSITLKSRPSIYSATSITNMTSISDDNLPLHTDGDVKTAKKDKSKKFKIYKKIINKFKKGKSPEKEIVKVEKFDCASSLKSTVTLKDFEMGSKHSLKSNNESNNNSLKKFITNLKKTNSVEIKSKDTEKSHIIMKTDITENDEKKISVKNVEIKTQLSKNEKSKLFINILKKRQKVDKHFEEKIVAEKLREKKEIVFQSKPEIEAEVIEDFNQTLKSLTYVETEKISVETVVTKVKKEIHPDVHTNIIEDSKIIPFYNENSDDHLFPDSVTATKIFGSETFNIPYIDDPSFNQDDMKSFYNGESRIFRINPDFFVPMASMETLYFPGESIKKKSPIKPLISQSLPKNKKALGNIFGCTSRGR